MGRRNQNLYNTEPFVKLPKDMLESPAWMDLSLRARDLFVRLDKKYNGKNNGDLSMPLSELKRDNELSSPTSLRKALDELWSHGFIRQTREGSFGSTRVCNLWALTTRPVDENREKSIKGMDKPPHDWRDWRPDQHTSDFRNKFPQVRKKRQKRASRKSNDSKTCTQQVRINDVLDTATGTHR